MNVALIIAGGSGHRMGQDIPKQFINVYDKPVLIYTLEGFQRHPMIDAIELVCIDGWHDVARAYAKQFGIDKLKWVISGGEGLRKAMRPLLAMAKSVLMAKKRRMESFFIYLRV
jgi:2-C-methyl-D-erythritol 4-phosphate cytidylyltransferase